MCRLCIGKETGGMLGEGRRLVKNEQNQCHPLPTHLEMESFLYDFVRLVPQCLLRYVMQLLFP